ncbi:hypothetical protein BD289DRAFT_431797 [Coniella lustricola]|uniref:Uncharacterized protein n=1 Tax=Coniella lustricola TaxID=2025994 RepID=A0A2T3AAG3_9PEZI|nr:hypothetical protein BD289DRAFT_431797 [Coniella lustricola]
MSVRSSSSIGGASRSSTVNSVSSTHKLHRIAFQGEDFAHWAMLLPLKTGVPVGLLVHIGVRKDVCHRPVHHELLMHIADTVSTTASEAVVIPGTNVSESQLRQAAEAVFRRSGNNYHMLTNNCQHFCIDVVIWLHQHYPDSVTKEAIRDCEGRGTKAIAFRKFIFWTRFTSEGREARAKAKQAASRQAELAQPRRTVSYRPRMSID